MSRFLAGRKGINCATGVSFLGGVQSMLKRASFFLTISIVAVSVCSQATLGRVPSQEITKAEEQEARALAMQFIEQFAEAKDLTPVVEHLYVPDFIERFNKSKLKQPETSLNLYFAPGLDYDESLLSQGTPDDWRQFYIAENNFLFLGIMYAFKRISGTGQDIRPTDIYPQQVINLLNQNPNLSNVVVRKGPGKPIKSIDELHQATRTLQQAVTIMREQTPGKLDKKELSEALKDNMFKPQVEMWEDEKYVGVRKDSRIIFMKTPILFFLIFVKEDNRLKILYAIPYSAD
jgi:hypothetical protein